MLTLDFLDATTTRAVIFGIDLEVLVIPYIPDYEDPKFSCLIDATNEDDEL
jgi:hypothetical protein